MRALALTDLDSLAGVATFARACRDFGIRPVIGVDLHIATTTPSLAQAKHESTGYRVLLLAENDAGYRNLVQLVNVAYTSPRRSRPAVTLELLEKHAVGIMCITGGSTTELHALMLHNKTQETEKYIGRLAGIFGRENLVLQLEDQDSPRQKQINDRLYQLSSFLDVRCVATAHVCYLRPGDSLAHDFLTRSRVPAFLPYQGGKEGTGHSHHMATVSQMRERFLKYPRALYATEEVADRCTFQPNFEKRRFPEHDFVRGFDADSYLWDLTFREARARFVELSGDMKNRLNEEFDYIKSHGLSNNILLLWNIAQFARKNRINMGVGRGDSISSLVAYILGITRINPLDYKLRFLGFGELTDPEHGLSIEIPTKHIEALHELMRETFGSDFCTAIGKYIMVQKQTLERDIRTWLFGKPGKIAEPDSPAEEDKPALRPDAPIEEFFPGKVDGVALPCPEAEKFLLARLYPRPKELTLDENQFAISAENLNHITPRVEADDQIVTQMDAASLDLFHIPRLHVVSNPVLNVLDSAGIWVRKEENANFDPDRIPMEDDETYALLSRGLTNGIEPFSSITLKSLLRAHRPRNFMSLVKIKSMERSPDKEQETDVREHVPECLLTYRCAFVKAHYPLSFMASLLTHSFRNRRKFTVILREAKQMGIRILPPDINLSVYEFSQVHKSIRTGLMVVSGMGTKAYAELARVRKGGDFNDLTDLVRRTDPRLINTRLLANLVKAGALDCFGLRRSQMLQMIEQDVEAARRNVNAPAFFDEEQERQPAIPGIEPPDVPELPLQEIIRNEIAVAGYCISYDQLHLYRDLVRQCRALSPDQLTQKMVGREVHVAGFLDHVETDSPLVEDSDQLLLDLEGHVVTMPVKVSKLYDQALHASAPVLIGGTVHRRKDEVYVKALTAFTLRMVQQMSQQVLELELDLSGEDTRTLWLIRKLVSFYRGKGTRVKVQNFSRSTLGKWWASGIERTPVFFSPPFYYALKKILPEERIKLLASEDMDPALLHALSPLRFERSAARSVPDPEDENAIVDMY